MSQRKYKRIAGYAIDFAVNKDHSELMAWLFESAQYARMTRIYYVRPDGVAFTFCPEVFPDFLSMFNERPTHVREEASRSYDYPVIHINSQGRVVPRFREENSFTYYYGKSWKRYSGKKFAAIRRQMLACRAANAPYPGTVMDDIDDAAGKFLRVIFSNVKLATYCKLRFAHLCR
jgi:hypothetical protein